MSESWADKSPEQVLKDVNTMLSEHQATQETVKAETVKTISPSIQDIRVARMLASAHRAGVVLTKEQEIFLEGMYAFDIVGILLQEITALTKRLGDAPSGVTKP